MSYRYETHLHTRTASACARSGGADYISFYKKLGYTGIIVTDHFFNGNTCISANLPWEQRIEQFCQGYKEAKAEGDRQGLQVFFGWEDCFDGDEYLVYGLDQDWLLQHPDILTWDHITHYERIKADGGLVVQAHPFRERNYLSRIDLHPYQCDAWEAANACNPAYQNLPALSYAHTFGLPVTAGSDIHEVGCTSSGQFYGVAFDEPLTSIRDYVDRIKAGSGYHLSLSDAMPALDERTESVSLPVYLFDRNNAAARLF